MGRTELLFRICTVVIAIIGGVVAHRSLIQKRYADDRTAWWQRFQWVLEQTVSDDNQRQALGWAALPHLATSPMLTRDDGALAQAIFDYFETFASQQSVLESSQQTMEDNDGQDSADS